MRALLLAVVITLYIRFLGWTTRLEYVGMENIPAKPFLYIFWHRYILFLPYTHRGKAIRVLVSTSKDGDISNIVNRQFGQRIIRGTASSPSEARRSLISIIRCMKEKNVVALTPDGPHGPAGEVKNGIPFIAKKVGCPVVPVAWSVKRKKILNSWDKFILALPFNKGVFVTGKPIYIDPEEGLDDASKRIKGIMNQLEKTAQQLL
ncbi:lysophospholipid acyltransferase family protein [Elusimicrobiota bacterium]